jgi:hypothetical protein
MLMRLLSIVVMSASILLCHGKVHAQSSSYGPEGSGGIILPTATPTVIPPAATPTPVPRNRVCQNDPEIEVQCGPGTNVGVNYKVMCTSIEELFRAMNIVAPAWIPYWREVENWIPWIDLGGEVRLVTNWRTAQNPSQYTYGATGDFWSDINPLYDPATGNLVRSGNDNRNVSHCVTRTGLLCGCGRNNDDGCFPPGVAITMADGRTKLVEDVVAGDLLWNPVTKAPVKVLQIVEGPEKRPLVRITTENTSLTTSQEHPVRVATSGQSPLVRVAAVPHDQSTPESPWRVQQARSIKIGDQIQLSSGETSRVTSVNEIPAEEGLYVINFVLEGAADDTEARMLVADGVVTGDLVVQQRLARQNNNSYSK